MKQTSVEWLWNQIADILPFTVDTETGMALYEAFQKAKEMEEQQLNEAWQEGAVDAQNDAAKEIRENYVERSRM